MAGPRKDFGQSRTSRPAADTGTSQRDHRSGCTSVVASSGELRTTGSCSSRILSVVVCRLAKSVNLESADSRPSTYIPLIARQARLA
jgi:hypothetical protein